MRAIYVDLCHYSLFTFILYYSIICLYHSFCIRSSNMNNWVIWSYFKPHSYDCRYACIHILEGIYQGMVYSIYYLLFIIYVFSSLIDKVFLLDGKI